MSNVIDTSYMNLTGTSYCNTIEKTSKTFETVLSKKEEAFLPIIEGDVIMHDPPSAIDKERFSAIVSKSKDDMTLNEYKLYICNKIANSPVSEFWRAYGNGSLIIKEEAFSHMKEDPEYEEQIIKLINSEFTVVSAFPIKVYGYQVIGGTIDECYGEGYGDTSSDPTSSDKEESFWQKRHKKIKKLIKEQAELAQKQKELKAEEERQKMFEVQFAYQQELHRQYWEQNLTANSDNIPLPVKKGTAASVPLQTVFRAVGEYENSSMNI